MKSRPFVTFVIPTLNEEKNIKRCLSSVKDQDYPGQRYEVLVVDGGSGDKTREIARRMGAKVLDNPARGAEYGKALGIKKARGEFVVLLDADNVCASSDWLGKMISPLTSDGDLFGMESFYLIADDFTFLNRYVSLLHIADPLARAFSPSLKKKEKRNYIKYRIDPEKGVPPLGANGFIWRKSVIDEVWGGGVKFEESNFGKEVVEKGWSFFGRVPGKGIYHYYVRGLRGFIKKRAKIAGKFLKRKKKKQKTWVDAASPLRFWGAVFYCASFIGPLAEGIKNSIRDRDLSWIVHPVCCFLTVTVYGFFFVKAKIKK